MTKIDSAALDRAIDDLPHRFKGPGGALAVVKDGEVIARHAFGYADLALRIPFTPRTPTPICSITKQFTCATLLDAFPDPEVLAGALADMMPRLDGVRPRLVDLCNNQSGLRDYWALTVLCGATPEADFRPQDARAMMARTQSLHFAPGTQYSYSNGNFRLLSDLIENRLGRPFEDVLAARILGPAGMATASLQPETRRLPGDAIGYEGHLGFGFVPAVNRIHWTGDAGLCASLDDMIAWERFIDATRDDEDGLYRRLARPQTFADGRPARYGYGLVHAESGPVELTGHGGALRGWRCQRLHAASERLSVVVIFNHHADARDAAMHLVRAALGQPAPAAPTVALDASWAGHYLDAATGLVMHVASIIGGRLAARYTTGPDILEAGKEGDATSPSMTLRRTAEGLAMERPGDNLRGPLQRVQGAAHDDIEGAFRSNELEATAAVSSAGGMMHIAFDGLLGRGPIHPLYPIGPDIWLMSCQRSMDAPAPGDWTVRIERDDDGAVAGFSIGCWLARNVAFTRDI